MLPNNDSQLQEQLAKVWRESQERLVKAKVSQTAPYIDLTKSPIQIEGLSMIAQDVSKEAQAVIFESKGRVVALAAVDPLAPSTVKLIDSLKTEGLTVRLFTASKQSIEYALGFYSYIPAEAKEMSGRIELTPEKAAKLGEQLITIPKILAALQKSVEDRVDTGELIEIIFAGAITVGASDIHFEPTPEGARLRYRLDGILQTIYEPVPEKIYKRIVGRIKLLAGLKINISSETQDGRFSIVLGELEIDFRISVVPAEFAETVVMRILDPRSIDIGIEDLGFRPDDMAIISRELKAPNGMILNTGPTGSGKTTTLYTFLRTVADSETKVITIEDPIEYHLDGIEQTQADERTGYTFASGLEAMMRQDPDVILVGEIRDKDTANTAIQAALTGHLVFSTLHTNSAPGVVPRLINLGVDITSLAPAINLIIAQRLVRKLCKKCKVPLQITEEMKGKIDRFLAKLPKQVAKPTPEGITLFAVLKTGEKNGCEFCGFTGYKGRLGVFELLPIGPEIEPIVRANAGEASVTKFARENGMVTLQEDAILRVLAGATTFEEVVGATGTLAEFA